MEEPGNVVIAARSAERPKKTGADFIADGENFDGSASRGEGVANVQSIIVDCPSKVIDVVALPRCGSGLVAWVGLITRWR